MRLIDGDKLYEDLWEAGMVFALRMVAAAPTIAPPPNDPLTLEELREMDGEPVWLEYDKCWVFVLVNDGIPMLANLDGERCKAENWIEIWGSIYRRKPEEGTNAAT